MLREKLKCTGSIHYSGRIYKSFGFAYRKCNEGRTFLLERRDIPAARNVFLRKMYSRLQNQDPRPSVYVDETWVNQNHSKESIWQDSTGNGGLKVSTEKGSRLIVCHTGSARYGFIKHAKLVCQSKNL